jgi:hypothetical protein
MQLEESRKESKEGSKERDERLAAARTEIEVSGWKGLREREGGKEERGREGGR